MKKVIAAVLLRPGPHRFRALSRAPRLTCPSATPRGPEVGGTGEVLEYTFIGPAKCGLR